MIGRLCMVFLLIFMQQKYWGGGGGGSSSRCNHVDSLFTSEEQKKAGF